MKTLSKNISNQSTPKSGPVFQWLMTKLWKKSPDGLKTKLINSTNLSVSLSLTDYAVALGDTTSVDENGTRSSFSLIFITPDETGKIGIELLSGKSYTRENIELVKEYTETFFDRLMEFR